MGTKNLRTVFDAMHLGGQGLEVRCRRQSCDRPPAQLVWADIRGQMSYSDIAVICTQLICYQCRRPPSDVLLYKYEAPLGGGDLLHLTRPAPRAL